MYNEKEYDEKEYEEETVERDRKGLVYTILVVVVLLLLGAWAVDFLKVEPDWAEGKPKQQVAVFMQTYLDAESLAYRINSTGVALAEPWDSCDSYGSAWLINSKVLKHEVFIVHQNAQKFGGMECIWMIEEMNPRAQFICVFITRDSRFFRDCPGGKIEYTNLMGLSTFGDILPR